MKKFLLLFLFMVGSANAQIIFQEDFDGIPGPTAGGAGTYNFPSGWLLRNVDNRTPAASVAYVNEAWERREDFGGSVIDSCAFSNSWYTPAGAANDWMWTPPVTVPVTGLAMLSWRGKAYDVDYRDGYEVRIMTDAPTGGTAVIGNQITNSTVLFSTPAENSTWTAREVSLSAYNGQTVRIGFRNNSTDKFILCIDDVTVKMIIPIAGELVEANNSSEYTRVPLNQRKPLSFSSKIKTTGTSALTAYLRVQALDAGDNVVFTSVSPTVTLANVNDVSALLTVAETFTPATQGTFTFKYNVMRADTNAAIGTELTYSIAYTDTDMARDNGVVTGSLGIGAGNGGYLGQSYKIESNTLLKSVDIFQNGNAETFPIEMGCAIFKLVAGNPELLFATTSQMIAPAAAASLMQYTIDPPLQIAAGDVIIVCAQEYGQTLAVAQTEKIFTAGSTYVDWPTSPIAGWAHNEDFGASFSKSYFIRPHLYCILDTPVAAGQSFCGTATVADLEATGDGLKWYTDADGGSPLSETTQLATGNYYVSQTIDICESDRVQIAVTVTPNTTNTTTTTACDSYVWSVNGNTYTDTGIYTSVDGCHTETLDLTVMPITANTTTTTACASYVWSVNGSTYTDTGIYTSVDGCHTETLDLTITPITTNTTTTSVCASYVWSVNGQTYTDSGVYTNVDGCHTDTLELTVTAAAAVAEQPQDVAITEGSDAVFEATVSGGTALQWQVSNDGVLWNDVAEGAGYTGTQTAVMTIDGSVVTVGLNGLQFRLEVSNDVCDAIYSDAATLSVALGIDAFGRNTVKVYPNPTAANVYIELVESTTASLAIFDVNGRLIKSLPLKQIVNTINTSDIASGIYFFKITTDKGDTVKKVIKN